MADLVAGDVTVTVEEENIIGKKRWHFVKIAFGDGALTYPASGVPMPAAAKFGMRTLLDRLIILDSDDAMGVLWKWDKENNKLRGYWPSGGAQTAPVAMNTDPGSGTPAMSGADSTTITTHTHSGAPGRGKEFVSATTTIPAQTMYALAIGY